MKISEKVKCFFCTTIVPSLPHLATLTVVFIISLYLAPKILSRENRSTREVELRAAAEARVSEIEKDNANIRQQLLAKHGLYLRTKKSLEEQVTFVNRCASYFQLKDKILFEMQRCTCKGTCARWKPKGKPSDCGNLMCPVCSKEDDPPESTKK